jgi:hypothetical protein
MKYLLTEEEITEILQHWKSTPANSYRGSGYGESNKKVLFQAFSEDTADTIISKIQEDIPLFASLSSTELAVYTEDLGFDKKRIHISVGGVILALAETEDSQLDNYTGDTFNANAQ